MRKYLLAFLPALVLAGCGTIDYTAPLAGSYDTAGVAIKSFIVIGTVSVRSTELHSGSPFGFVKKVEGSKITYSDLMLEAARLDADDIVDVRIDINTSGKTTFVDWVKGWERTFTYTGQAIAVKYADKASEEEPADPTELLNR